MPDGSMEQRDYSSYLLRMWRVGEADGPTWRASLKSVYSGKQVGFASLEDLFHHLRNETGMMLGADRDSQELS